VGGGRGRRIDAAGGPQRGADTGRGDGRDRRLAALAQTEQAPEQQRRVGVQIDLHVLGGRAVCPACIGRTGVGADGSGGGGEIDRGGHGAGQQIRRPADRQRAEVVFVGVAGRIVESGIGGGGRVRQALIGAEIGRA